MEIRINGVNVFNPLEGKLDDIIECFVEFYGEKHREKITHNLKNTEYFFLPKNKLNPLQPEFERYFSTETKKVYKELYERISPNGRKMPEIIGSSVKISDLQTIKAKLQDYSPEEDKRSWNRTQYDANALLQYMGLQKTAEDLAREKAERENIPTDSEEFMEIMHAYRRDGDEKTPEELHEYFLVSENRDRVCEFIEMCEEKFVELGYDKIIDDLNKQQETVYEQIKEVDNVINASNREAGERIHDFVASKINETLEKQGLETKKSTDWDMIKYAKIYEGLLNTDLTQDTKWLGDYKKEKFVKFFQELGFNYGDKFEDYLDSPEIQQTLINEKIYAEYNKLILDIQNDVALKNPILSEYLSKIEKRGTVNAKDLFYGLANYMNGFSSGAAYVSPSFTRTGEMQKFLVCEWGLNDHDSKEHLDCNLVHELGHIATASSFVANKDVYWKAGFDFAKDFSQSDENINQENEDERRYEALNEIINDYFTLDIYKVIREKGIILNLGHQELKTRSTYQDGFRLMEGFIESHKQEIKDSLMSDNPMAFAEIIGKENYDLLADACTEYLSLTTNMDNHIKFIQQVNALRAEFDAPFFVGVLLQEEWYGSSKPFADCFKKVAQVERNIQLAKTKNTEIDKTKDAEITL